MRIRFLFVLSSILFLIAAGASAGPKEDVAAATMKRGPREVAPSAPGQSGHGRLMRLFLGNLGMRMDGRSCILLPAPRVRRGMNAATLLHDAGPAD